MRVKGTTICHSPRPNLATSGPPVTIDLAPLIIITGKRPAVDVIGPQGLIFLLLQEFIFSENGVCFVEHRALKTFTCVLAKP